eukprot:TRINITY_DN7681_c0_g1_i1.p1 TRINITY_DN7681_c0_g1~~TRINITY_DN7681_c0_g1_i1.p1  ORF type:complete len:435 (+),score=78.46 TRINITY_DN7681_c0_g1_i1:25-1305(+)
MLASYEEALAAVLAAVPSLPARAASFGADGAIEAGARFPLALARDVAAAADVPGADVSTREGFALRAEGVQGELLLRVVRAGGAITAGNPAPEGFTLGRGEAVRVTTGAAIPAGADCVAPEEWCEYSVADGVVRVVPQQQLQAGVFVARAGSDVARGSVVARRGMQLTPGVLAAVASAGCASFWVTPPPRVAIVSTGDELVPAGGTLRPGSIYASNAVQVAAALRRAFGVTECASDFAPDSESAIRDCVARHLGDCDVVITCGGVWGSERDLVLAALSGIPGFRLLFHRVKLGPGKSAAFGVYDLDGGSRRVPVFCLPGTPTANQAALMLLALPGIAKMTGASAQPFFRLRLPLLHDVGRGKGTGWVQVFSGNVCAGVDGGSAVSCRNDRRESRLAHMAAQDCLVVVGADKGDLHAGSLVDVILQL